MSLRVGFEVSEAHTILRQFLSLSDLCLLSYMLSLSYFSSNVLAFLLLCLFPTMVVMSSSPKIVSKSSINFFFPNMIFLWIVGEFCITHPITFTFQLSQVHPNPFEFPTQKEGEKQTKRLSSIAHILTGAWQNSQQAPS